MVASLPKESNINFIQSHLWVSVCFTALALFFQLCFLEKIDVNVIYILFFTALGGYNFISNHKKWIKNKRFEGAQLVVLVSFIIVVYNYFQLENSRQIYIGLGISAISFLYELHGFPYSLRNYPYLKLIYIALIWTLFLVWFNLNLLNGLLIFSCFFFILGITIPFDIRDIEEDSNNLTKKIGLKRAKQYSYLSLMASMVLWYFLQVDYVFFFAYVFSILTAIIAIMPLNYHTSKLYISFVIEGVSVLPLLLLLITKIPVVI